LRINRVGKFNATSNLFNWETTGYWGFNADLYMKYSSTEKWDTIPADKRDTRDTLVSAAGAYLDAFLEQKKDLVPWGYPCVRGAIAAYRCLQ
jgi:hypothetical protein